MTNTRICALQNWSTPYLKEGKLESWPNKWLYVFLIDNISYLLSAHQQKQGSAAPSTPEFSRQGWVERKSHLHQPPGSALHNAAQDDVCFHCCKSILLAQVPLGIQGLFWRDAFQLVSSCLCGYSVIGARLHTSLPWTLWNFCQSISPAYWGSCKWQQNQLLHQPFFLVLCCLQTCWECTLSYPLVH